MPDPTSEEQDESAERPPFEDVIAALLQVDPTGIAGKHRKQTPDAEKAPPPK